MVDKAKYNDDDVDDIHIYTIEYLTQPRSTGLMSEETKNHSEGRNLNVSNFFTE